MNRKNLAEKFENAFNDPEKIKAEEYQKIIEANASKAADNTERLTFTLLGLATLLILIVHGQIKKLDLGFVEIENPSIIMIAIPVLVAYVHYDLIATLSKFDVLSIIHKAIIKQRHLPIHTNGLSKYFLFLPSIYENRYHATDGISSQIQPWLWFFEFLFITVLTPFGSEWIAFTELRTHPNPEYSPLLYISISITIILNFQSILTIFTLLQGIGDN
jgi:hypothetical protein